MKTWDQGQILITGGAGFIGSAILWELNRRGFNHILICDTLGRDERFRNLIPLHFADIFSPQDLLASIANNDTKLADIGCIFHLGACANTAETDADFLIQNNYEFSKKLAEWAVSKNIRFVYASSAATYGNGIFGMSDEEKELPTLRSLNMYGYSKHLFDLYAHRRGLLPYIYGMKYFNIFGPNEYHKGPMMSFIPRGIQQLAEKGALHLFKSYRPDCVHGEQTRDFLYVKDAAKISLFLAELPQDINHPNGGIYNIGSGVASRWLDLAQAISHAMGLSPRMEFIDMPETLKACYQYHTQANIQKLRKIGYIQEITPLEEAVRDYVQNYLLPSKKYLGEEVSIRFLS
ncbi:MAG: ADP-glyceromanno-heptose 6-epimerase [Puniceicoccales bacterium]|jgi:ADP-L-glycero-D-manno-heptose 6-epimerase|nr:ADP-glyceromanno-heptose 6-epimerase [Puniceicoccales bacterium]